MAYGSVDPASLEGADLIRWYQRSPWDIEQERLAARRKQYLDFFGIDPSGTSGEEASGDSATGDPMGVATGDYQSPAQTLLPTSPGPLMSTGYIPGVLGDLRWLTNPPSSQYPLAKDIPPAGAHLAETPVPIAGDEPQIQAPSGAFLDNRLWPTGSDPTLTTIIASSGQRPKSLLSGGQTPPKPPTAQPGPIISLRPSDGFFSWLFGGPVPIKDSTGAITGYYDHQAANEGLKITGAYAGVAPFFQPGSWAGDLLNEIAPAASGAISDGIEEAIANHHPWPKYLGGPHDQELVPLRASLHRMFHSQLGAAMRQEGFPPVGGVDGSAVKWADHFLQNEGTREKAIATLRQVTADFDRANGTSITPKLEQALRGGGTNLPK